MARRRSFVVDGLRLDLPEQYRPLDVLGYGAYGLVCRASDESTGAAVAIKRIGPVFDSLPHARRVAREVATLRSCAHPNILRCLDVVLSVPTPGTIDAVCIVTPAMTSDLAQRIARHPLSSAECAAVTAGLCSGLAHLHARGICHRDLKPANILLGDSIAQLRIADFGLAAVFGPHSPLTTDARIDPPEVASLWYRAPELLAQQHNYTEAVDVWAIGCIVFECWHDRPLAAGSTVAEVLGLLAHNSDVVDVTGAPELVALRERNPATVFTAGSSLIPASKGPLPSGLARILRSTLRAAAANRASANELEVIAAEAAAASPASVRRLHRPVPVILSAPTPSPAELQQLDFAAMGEEEVRRFLTTTASSRPLAGNTVAGGGISPPGSRPESPSLLAEVRRLAPSPGSRPCSPCLLDNNGASFF
eukprot:m.30863 g.30863  ORF g.30863 m.30863 type:complete len:421 (+) comp5267_c0_seq1:133-1395(+)